MKETSSAPSPVAVFAYRRPEHLRRTLQALRENVEASRTELFIFCDGAKGPADQPGVEAVYDVVRAELGFAHQHIIRRPANFGLARNITEGVSEVLRQHDTVIVIEDDVVVSPFLMKFMNDAFRTYRDEPRVGSVSGYCYPVSGPVPESYFIRGADCWGWGTWRDRWQDYDADGAALLDKLRQRGLTEAFDFDGAAVFVKMLEDQIAGNNDSWAVRWHASCYLLDRLILYPGRALARNIGNDGTGTHSSSVDGTLDVSLSESPVTVGGIAIEENAMAREAIRQFFMDSGKPPAPANPGAANVERGERIADRVRPGVRALILRLLPEQVKRVLRKLGSHLLPRPAAIAAPVSVVVPAVPVPVAAVEASQYWGLNELDRQIEKHLQIDSGYFVELGANDGRFQSNTYYYEKMRNWRGVLIEPAPNLYLQCRANRSLENHIVCAACVGFDYTDEFVKLIYSNAMSVSLNVESDIGDPAAHAELGRQFLQKTDTVFAFGAIARTLNSILLEAGAPSTIDFLSLDVEGAEIEVLKGVDHARFRFARMLVECRNIDRLRAYLEPLHYRLVERFNEHDYLFACGDTES